MWGTPHRSRMTSTGCSRPARRISPVVWASAAAARARSLPASSGAGACATDSRAKTMTVAARTSRFMLALDREADDQLDVLVERIPDRAVLLPREVDGAL